MRGERSTRMCRGAHYIGVDKRVNAPWFIVLSAFVSSRIPHQCTCECEPWVTSTRRRVPPCVRACTQPRCTSLRVSRRPCARTGKHTCNERRVTTPPAAANGRPQVKHTGVDHAGTSAHSVTVATGPTCDKRNTLSTVLRSAVAIKYAPSA